MILVVKFSNGKGHVPILTFGASSRTVSTVEFDVQSAYFRFQITEIVLFIFYHDPVLQDLVLDLLYLTGIFPLLLRQFSH